MKKTLFAIIISCLAVSMAFGQQLNEEIQLSEDKPQIEIQIKNIGNDEHGRIIVKINGNGKSDKQGRTPVQIELQNTSSDFNFLICDHVWDKKELRKNHVYIEKGCTVKSTQIVNGVEMNSSISIPCNSDDKYTFPNVYIGEEEKKEILIPVHLIKPAPGLFCKKRTKLYSIIPCTLFITVNIRDQVYEKLQEECDSLFEAFNGALEIKEFCTNPKHGTMEEQTKGFFNKRQELENKISECSSKCSTGSKKKERYNVLYDSVHKMKAEMETKLENYQGEKHDCGKHKPIQPTTCKYCNSGLSDIAKSMGDLYFDLRRGNMEQTKAQKEAKVLYNCCTKHKKQARQFDNSEYKKTINDYYEKIVNWKL